MLFTRQLSVLLLSQAPPVEALHTLASQASNSNLKDKILRIASDIEGGTSFFKALSNYPKPFSSFYVNMVKSGEESGNLPRTLNTLADHLEREYDLSSKLKAAILYPAFVLFIMFVMFVLMLFFIFPELERVLAAVGGELPAITLFVINLANFIRQWFFVLFLFCLAGLGLLVYYLRMAEGKAVFDNILLRFPFLKNLLKKVYLARFAENLSTLITGGLPIAQALEISSKVVGNTVYQKIILMARDGVRKGESVSSVFKRFPNVIPPLVVQMLFIGERTGQLDKVLAELDIFYKKEVDLAVNKFISLLEPLLIVFLGLAVAALVLTVLLPIYRIGV